MTRRAHTGRASGAPARAYFTFTKRTNADSTLSLWVESSGTATPALEGSWRAGCGRTTNPCAVGAGWLPNGTYTITGSASDWAAPAVRGPTIALSDKACADGTVRTQLLIHSSYPWSSADYESRGCIKVSSTGGLRNPGGDIEQVYSMFLAFMPGTVEISGP